MPIPRPIKRQFFRCCSLASRNRGNHSNGAETSLPSAKVTRRASDENVISTMRGSSFTAKVLIPFLLKYVLVLLYQLSQSSNFTAAKSLRFSKLYGIQPKFGITLSLFNMNMCRFITFTAEKEKAITFYSQNCWHKSIYNFLTTLKTAYATSLFTTPWPPLSQNT
jgi:hypothetical protein